MRSRFCPIRAGATQGGSVRVRLSVGIAVSALAVLIAGCSSSSGKPAATAAPPPTTTPTTVERPAQAIVSANDVKVIPGSATGQSPCEKAAPNPTSPGQVGAGTGGSDKIKN